MSQAVDVRNKDVVKSVSFTTDTSAYASGDLVADTQEIANAVYGLGGVVTLDSIVLTDGADQKVALYVVFLNASTSMGTENSAPNISDANVASKIIGHVAIAATDYVDVGGAGVATIKNIGLKLQAASTSGSLYVAIVNSTGTPTYAADSLVGKFGFSRVEQHNS